LIIFPEIIFFSFYSSLSSLDPSSLFFWFWVTCQDLYRFFLFSRPDKKEKDLETRKYCS